MTTKYPLYKRFAMTVQAYHSCIESGNREWEEKHYSKIIEYINILPHGSGIDGQASFDFDESNGNKLVIHIEYHYMNENGYYDGWYPYKIVITPSLVNDFEMKFVGKNTPNDAKEYLYETFDYALREEIEQ